MFRELVCRHGEEGWDRGRVAAAFFSTAHHTAAGEALLLLAAAQLPHTITDYILLTRGNNGRIFRPASLELFRRNRIRTFMYRSF
jgi:hypothetical protein